MLGALWLGLLRPAGAAPATLINARVDADAGQVRGTAAVRFANVTAAPLERAYVWLLPNRMAAPPAAQNDVNHYWIYPKRFNPGSMELSAVRAGAPGHERAIPAGALSAEPHAVAGRGVLWSVALPEPAAPGEIVSLVMEFWAKVPERYGSLGCIRGRCTLAGGFYPMLATLDGSGWDLTAPPMRTDMDVRIELARPGAVVLFGKPFGAIGQGAPVTRAAATARGAAYATLLVAPRLYPSERRKGPVTLRYLAPEPPPPADDAREKILPYTQEDYARFALDSAAEALELLDVMGAPAAPQVLTLVEAPLRFALAEAHPGAIVVSDRFYRIWPAERFRKFHQRELVRAVFAQVVGRAAEQRGAERDRDIPMAADLLASYLTDLFVVRQYRKTEFMDDILAPVAFIPLVDQLLYAPQTMFASAYFGGVLDDELLRDHPARFMHERPRGRLFYEKLRDLLSAEALTAALRAMLVDGVEVKRAAKSAYGAPMDWFFRQWSRPYPRLDYRLVGSSCEPVGQAAGPGEYDCRVIVERRTGPMDTPPVEPVVVDAVLSGGKKKRLVWDGRGDRGVLGFRSDQPITRVVVDPENRLVEQNLLGENAHPRFDNRDVHRVRFVYNSFGVLLNVTDLSALLAADFTLGRVHDRKNRTRITLFTSSAVKLGLSGRYARAFGPAVTEDRLLSNLSLRLSAQRLRGDFFADSDEREASRLSLGLSLGASNRVFVFEPRFARDASLGASLTVTRRDAVAGGPDADYLVSGTLGAGMSRLHTFAGDHTLAVDLDASVALGDIVARSQLVSAGGVDGLRGYAPGALFGRARLMARGEYRHVFAHDLSWNLGHYNIVRGAGGALFADVGLLSSCDGYDLFGSGGAYASAGYGVRFFYDSFGTLSQLMRIDVAVRLVDRQRQCLGAPALRGQPVMVYVQFLPPF